MKRATFPTTLTLTGFYLFAFSIPISHVPAQFGIAFSFIGWFLEGLLNKRWQIQRHVFFIPLTFYLIWNILSSAISERPLHSLTALIDNEWPALLMVMLFWNVKDVRVLKRIVNLFLFSSSIAMVYAMWETFAGVELYRNLPLDPMGNYYRAVGFYGFYLTFAAFAMSVLFLAASHSVEAKGRRRWMYLSITAISFFAIIGTFARSIWLAIAALIPLFSFLKSKKLGLIVTASLVVVIIAVMLTVPAIKERIFSIVDVTQNETRLNLWKTAIAVWKDTPVLGIGEDNWDLVFERFKVPGFYDTTVHPHNDYLTVLVSSGIIGFLNFIALWFIALWTGLRTSRRAKDNNLRAIANGSTVALCGFLIGSFFQNYYGSFINCLGWWFVAGLIFASAAVAQSDENLDPQHHSMSS
ncbi:MAG: O-antigen ligase family protein [bacterium]